MNNVDLLETQFREAIALGLKANADDDAEVAYRALQQTAYLWKNLSFYAGYSHRKLMDIKREVESETQP